MGIWHAIWVQLIFLNLRSYTICLQVPYDTWSLQIIIILLSTWSMLSTINPLTGEVYTAYVIAVVNRWDLYKVDCKRFRKWKTWKMALDTSRQ